MMSEYERGLRDGVNWARLTYELYEAIPGEPRTENGHYKISFIHRTSDNTVKGTLDYIKRMSEIAQNACVSELNGQDIQT